MANRTFLVTEQTASVVNRVYEVAAESAESAESAQEAFEMLEGDARSELLVKRETIRQHVEIIGVEPV
jgi:hypothetical protein